MSELSAWRSTAWLRVDTFWEWELRVRKSEALEKANVDSDYYLKEIEKRKKKLHLSESLLRRVGGQFQLNLKFVSAPGGCAVGGMRSGEFWEGIV